MNNGGSGGLAPRTFEIFENIEPNRANLELSVPIIEGDFELARPITGGLLKLIVK